VPLALLAACGSNSTNAAAPLTIAPGSVRSASTTAPTTLTPTTLTPTTIAVTTTTLPPRSAMLAATGTVTISIDGGAATPATGEVAIAPGTSIETGDGEATITYDDGSLLRLDNDTTVEFNQTSQGSLTTGRVWARVATQKAAEPYRIETSAGDVTATGTAFVVTCPTEAACTVVVVEGSVDATAKGSTISVKAPSSMLLGSAQSTPVNWDNVFGDPWVLKAANADESIGWIGPVGLAKTLGPTFASMSGTFTATRTITECAPDNSSLCRTPIGTTAERTYVFSLECSMGFPCRGKVRTEYTGARSGEKVEAIVDAMFDGASYRWELTVGDNPLCTIDEESDGVIDKYFGEGSFTLAWTLTPSAADVTGTGIFSVTTATGTVTTKETVLAKAELIDPRCAPFVAGNSSGSIEARKTSEP
jgi:hypothetical protein